MQRSNWREEIELPEFVQSFNLLTKGYAAFDAVNRARQNPLVQKGFKAIKNKAVDLLTPKSFKEIDKPKVEVKPEVNTNIKGFKPKGFTPSKEIENERQKLIKQRELEKIKEKEIDKKLKPLKKETGTGTEVKPVETPQTETETTPKENDNKKKITTITKIRNNQNNNEKNINKNDLNKKNKNKDNTRIIPLPFGLGSKTKRKTPVTNKKRVPAGIPRRLPRLPLPNKKPINPQARAIERLAATRDRDGDGKLERKRKSGEYQETFNHNISETSTMNTQKTKVTNIITEPTTKVIADPRRTTSKIGSAMSAVQRIGSVVSGKNKTAASSKKVNRLAATRDRDGDGKVERRRKSGEFQETLLYDVVLDYIISENFASDIEGANKVMLKLSDELMQEIYERTMTASEKRKDTMLKKKYDDSDMKKNMQDQYGKEEGKKVYFATIRKQAMKKEEVIPEDVGVSTAMTKARKEAELKRKEAVAVAMAKKVRKEEVKGDKVVKMVKAVTDEKKRKNALQIQKYIGEEEQLEGYGSDRVGPALRVARAIDSVNPRPTPNSKRTRASRALKLASIKKDEKIRKRQENPYSADKRLKMVATSIRDRVKQKAKALTRSEEVVTELNRYEKEKGIDTKTKKPVTKGGTAKKDLAFQAVMKKYSSQRMGGNEPKKVRGVKSDEGTGRITKMLAKKKEQQAKSKELDAKAKKAGYKTTQDYVNVQAVRKGGLGT